jgi:hypothetical protein
MQDSLDGSAPYRICTQSTAPSSRSTANCRRCGRCSRASRTTHIDVVCPQPSTPPTAPNAGLEGLTVIAHSASQGVVSIPRMGPMRPTPLTLKIRRGVVAGASAVLTARSLNPHHTASSACLREICAVQARKPRGHPSPRPRRRRSRRAGKLLLGHG